MNNFTHYTITPKEGGLVELVPENPNKCTKDNIRCNPGDICECSHFTNGFAKENTLTGYGFEGLTRVRKEDVEIKEEREFKGYTKTGGTIYSAVQVHAIYSPKQEKEEENQFPQVENMVQENPREEENGWISVKDRLPASEGRVLVFDEDGDICIGFAFEVGKEDKYTVPATHWRPLPEPPKIK